MNNFKNKYYMRSESFNSYIIKTNKYIIYKIYKLLM